MECSLINKSSIKKQLLFLLMLVVAVYSCKSTVNLPKNKLRSTNTAIETIEAGDGRLLLKMINPLKCPVRFSVTSDDDRLKGIFPQGGEIVLSAQTDSIIDTKSIRGIPVTVKTLLGDVDQKINEIEYALPIYLNDSIRIIQGYDSPHSHNNNFSRYALDFDLKVGDTIYASASGYVVGLIQEYKDGGVDIKWIDYANYLTLYHPDSHTYSQYVHLDHRGSLVSLGQEVQQGEAIGISGQTGYTDIPHLHFNVLVPENSDKGLKSVAVFFKNGLDGKTLKRGDKVYRID